MRASVLALVLSALLTLGATLPADELSSLVSENAALKAELQSLRQQNGTPMKVPPARQNLAGSKPNIVILFGGAQPPVPANGPRQPAASL